MTSNVTAVSYGLDVSPTALEQLRSILTSQGAAVLSEVSSGDGRYQVHTAELQFPDATAAGLAGLLMPW
ncbi:MAG: phosphoserine phosphatase SerB, partial [Actinomycetes bacterium]